MEPKKILIVDDSEIFIDFMTNWLNEAEDVFKTITAYDGRSACEKAKEMQPDLIVMDWQMEGLDGFEAMKIIKKQESTKQIPVIMATGVMLSPEELAMAFDAGADDYIRKPFSDIELISRIKNVLRHTEKTNIQEKEPKKVAEEKTDKELNMQVERMLETNKSLVSVFRKMQEMLEKINFRDKKQEVDHIIKKLKSDTEKACKEIAKLVNKK